MVKCYDQQVGRREKVNHVLNESYDYQIKKVYLIPQCSLISLYHKMETTRVKLDRSFIVYSSWWRSKPALFHLQIKLKIF